MSAQYARELADHVEDYLRLRRALGFKLVWQGQALHQFVAYLQAAGATTLTTQAAIAWARLPVTAQPIAWQQRLGVIRGFARYLATIDPATEIPPPGVFPGAQRRRTPYVYSTDEINQLLHAARALHPPFHAATHETFLALLAVTGMRVGEALPLRHSDVDLDNGVLSVTGGKYDRPRLVPIHTSTTAALARYAQQRDHLAPPPTTTAFFLNQSGAPLTYAQVRRVFGQITTDVGLRTPTTRPRIHDLRHSFAVNTLLGWYRTGEDAAARMAALSTYLGHVSPAGTYWYLTAVPELMELAADRLEKRPGGRP